MTVDFKTNPHLLPQFAAQAAEMWIDAAAKLDVAMDYSEASVERIEDLLGQPSPEPLRGLKLELGAYLGEVMVRNLEGSTWGWAESVESAGVKLGGGRGWAFPFSRAVRRLDAEDSDDSVNLLVFYRFVRLQWSGDLPTEP